MHMVGSSPLTRGKRPRGDLRGQRDGLIPAHAGKTLGILEGATDHAAHPRSRGENSQAKTIPARGPGSSPLTRGKLSDDIAGRDDGRLIPAHAGKTRTLQVAIIYVRAHPRSRGENPRASRVRICARGSSPLTRGKHGRGAGGGDERRLIPAHAGKTRLARSDRHDQRAHPRSRGENAHPLGRHDCPRGSSPLTRGKLAQFRVNVDHSGLIPAHAGKTRGCYRAASALAAHPRSRGENLICRVDWELCGGSSPLTRGKPKPVTGSWAAIGLIPAHAGKTDAG